MAKFGAPQNQTNYISFESYWLELPKNVLFIEVGPMCQKLWAFCHILALIYHAHSLNMVMSRDPSCKFKKKIILC